MIVKCDNACYPNYIIDFRCVTGKNKMACLTHNSTDIEELMPMWYFRSDSNIVEDTKAMSLRDLFLPFQNWKEETIEERKNRLTITCFNCGNVATFSTGTTGSYPLCNNCRD